MGEGAPQIELLGIFLPTAIQMLRPGRARTLACELGIPAPRNRDAATALRIGNQVLLI